MKPQSTGIEGCNNPLKFHSELEIQVKIFPKPTYLLAYSLHSCKNWVQIKLSYYYLAFSFKLIVFLI